MVIVHKEDFYIIPRRWYKVNEVVVSINKMSTMNYATKFKFEQSDSEITTSQKMSLFLQETYFFINTDEQQLFLLTQIPLTVDKFYNFI